MRVIVFNRPTAHVWVWRIVRYSWWEFQTTTTANIWISEDRRYFLKVTGHRLLFTKVEGAAGLLEGFYLINNQILGDIYFAYIFWKILFSVHGLKKALGI